MATMLREKLVAEASTVARAIELWASTLPPPLLYHSGQQHYGFRFGTPGAAHYCILKIASAISCGNASLQLAEKGFLNEICMLHRVVAECCSHVDYVVAGFNENKLSSPQQRLVSAYFEDYQRNSSADFKRPKLAQSAVHKAVAADSKERISSVSNEHPLLGFDSEKAMSNVYLTFSNYIHCRYPEVMDLVGGSLPRFHVGGHSHAGKVAEAWEQVEAMIETTSVTLKHALYRLGFAQTLRADPKWTDWIELR